MRKSVCLAIAAVTVIAGAPTAAASPRSSASRAASPAARQPSSPAISDRLVVPAASPSGSPFNPLTGSQGFTVFVAGNGTLNSTSVGGPVALGGNLTIGTQGFNVATHTAGTFTAAGDAHPTGLLVGGNVNWAGSGANGAVNVQNNDYVKVGNMTGSAVAQSGTAPTHVVRAGQGYSSQPLIADTVNQPTASVSQSGLIGFSSAFSTFRSQSANLASCTNNVVLTTQGGTASVTLTSGVQNILDITAANLATYLDSAVQQLAHRRYATDHQCRHDRGRRTISPGRRRTSTGSRTRTRRTFCGTSRPRPP